MNAHEESERRQFNEFFGDSVGGTHHLAILEEAPARLVPVDGVPNGLRYTYQGKVYCACTKGWYGEVPEIMEYLRGHILEEKSRVPAPQGTSPAADRNPKDSAPTESVLMALVDMVDQFAYEGDGTQIHTGGLSALEYAFHVLGLSDPCERLDVSAALDRMGPVARKDSAASSDSAALEAADKMAAALKRMTGIHEVECGGSRSDLEMNCHCDGAAVGPLLDAYLATRKEHHP